MAMHTSFRPLRARPRQGIGALFVIAVGVIVVLAAIVGINQFSSLTQSTRDTTAALELTHKTSLVAESAVDEATYGTLPLDLNNPNASGDGLYQKLRSWTPAQAPRPEQPVFEGATPFLMQAKYAPKLTYDAMKSDESLKLASYDTDSNPVYYGPIIMGPLVSLQAGGPLVLMPESNESIGIMGFAHTARAKGSGFFKDLDQSVQFSRPYKCLLIGPPWPYHKYALFVLEFFGETQQQMTQFRERMTLVDPLSNPTRTLFQQRGPVKSGFAAFYRKVLWHDALVKAYKTAMTATSRTPSDIPTASINIDLNSAVVFEGDGSTAKLEPVPSSEPEIAALKAAIPGYSGTLEDVRADEFLQAFGVATPDAAQQATLDRCVDILTKVGTALKGLGDKIKVRNVAKPDFEKYFANGCPTPAYATISPQAWMARATRIYKGPGDLKNILNKDKTGYQLDGCYYFQGAGPYVLDKGFSGKGILVFEDGVTVQGFGPDDPNDSHAVVVTVPAPGKTDAVSITVASDVTADLVAPYGTVTAPGAAPAMPTAAIRGSVVVRFLPDAQASSAANYFESGTPSAMFPNIDRGNKSDWDYAPPSTGTYNPAHAKHMQVYYDPGYVKKLYWSKRDRD